MSEAKGAGEALAEAAGAALSRVAGLNGVHPPSPVKASHPYAVVEAAFEADWSHKSGDGREVRLSAVIHDGGERPDRLRRLMRAAERDVAAIGELSGGWRLVSLRFVRSRTVKSAGQWTGALEFRALMLAGE